MFNLVNLQPNAIHHLKVDGILLLEIASSKCDALLLFLSGSAEAYCIFTLPAVLLLKNDEDDIPDALIHPIKFNKSDALLIPIRKKAAYITKKYAKNASFIFKKKKKKKLKICCCF